MKTHRWFVAFLACALSGGMALAENPKNILFYGNSFTLGIGSTEAEQFGGVPEVVKQLAVAAGYPAPRVENAAVSGQSLAWHIGNNTGAIADPGDFAEVPDFQWDLVVLQEYSTTPTHIGDPAAFRSDANTLYGLVLSHSPAAQAVLFETWARGPGHSYYTGSPATFPGGPAQMQQELRDNYELARQELAAAHGAENVSVARVGDAWEATGWANLHATDIYHANTRGTYLTGLVLFGTIYGERTTAGLPKLFASLTAQEAADLQAVADQYLPAGLTFDWDGDHDIDATDVFGLVECLGGVATAYPPGAACLIMDGNDDAHVDLSDYALMQAQAFELPPTLSLATWDVVFNVPQGGGTDSTLNTVTADDGSTPSVDLAAVDLLTLSPPAWLSVPATVSAGVAFAVDVDVTGLTAGTQYARVTATADGYADASFTVTLRVTASGAQTLFFDFGDVGMQTTGNYNNVTHQQAPVVNAIDSAGLGTGVSLTVTDPFWPGSNTAGTTSPTGDAAMFEPQATRDNLFGNTVAFGDITEPTGGFTLGGLSTTPGVTYTFTFFGARLGVSDNRETAYAIAGATSATTYLNTANNSSQVAIVSGIAADANGEITVTVSPGPNNTNGNKFYYIGAMKIVRSGP